MFMYCIVYLKTIKWKYCLVLIMQIVLKANWQKPEGNTSEVGLLFFKREKVQYLL